VCCRALPTLHSHSPPPQCDCCKQTCHVHALRRVGLTLNCVWAY
jgi:hypothetical protein